MRCHGATGQNWKSFWLPCSRSSPRRNSWTSDWLQSEHHNSIKMTAVSGGLTWLDVWLAYAARFGPQNGQMNPDDKRIFLLCGVFWFHVDHVDLFSKSCCWIAGTKRFSQHLLVINYCSFVTWCCKIKFIHYWNDDVFLDGHAHIQTWKSIGSVRCLKVEAPFAGPGQELSIMRQSVKIYTCKWYASALPNLRQAGRQQCILR